GDRLVAGLEPGDVHGVGVAAGVTDVGDATPVGQGPQAALEGGADRVEHQVDAAAVGEATGHVGEVVGPVVDAVVEPERPQAVQLLVARRRGQHGRPRPLGQLDGGDAHAPG